MQANPHSPASIFKGDVRYVVPLFQRPYVWTKDDQWEPLWKDIEVLAERVLEAPTGYGAGPVPPHFLGAIVLENQSIPTGYILTRHIVDGQQRLTTLQLLLDAAEEVVEARGNPMDAQALRVLVTNSSGMSQEPDDDFKVWPTDRDQPAFRAAMRNSVKVPTELASSRIAQAHAYFVAEIEDWAGVEESGPSRLNALVRALRDHLRLVVIDLELGDNAQVIFETLNHRGSPLLAADLVKNFLFQIAQAQGANVQALYDDHWKVLDGDYWRQLVAQGRRFRPRIDVFLTYWLTMKTLSEVPNDHVFPTFRSYMVKEGCSVTETVEELVGDARVYAEMESLPADTVEGTFHYRVLRAMETASVGPFLLWLLRWSEVDLSADQRRRALLAVESWLVRRALCRLTGKGTNQVVLDLLKAVAAAGPATAGETTEAFLAGQTADARLWPDDASLLASLETTTLYTSITRPRMRMLLEALEDDVRSKFGEGQPCPRGLSVEHVMPRGWRDYWDEGIDEVQAARRDRRIHRLGNLTLVSGKLNPALSNRPWTTEGSVAVKLKGEGKRGYLLEHSNLILNAKLVASHELAWTDDDIRHRTSDLASRVISLWPRPSGEGKPSESAATDEASGAEDEPNVVESEGAYRALTTWLQGQDGDEVRLTFSDVEQIVGTSLPLSARDGSEYWQVYERGALCRAIHDAGWKADAVDGAEERVTLARRE